MEIKIIDGVEYYCYNSGRMYAVELMKELISDYLNDIQKEPIKEQIVSIGKNPKLLK